MGQMIEIQPQIRVRQTIPILDPLEDLRAIIDNDMGMDAARLFDDVIESMEVEFCEFYGIDKVGDDYEAISDGYRRMLVDTMNELGEILEAKRLDRKRIQQLYEQLYDNL